MTKQPPKVSIGMPVYNGEKFIRQALGSLLAQSFTDFELIISDNASTDDTFSICQAFAAQDPRIRLVRQPENLGAARNFQFVLREAVGKYFMWAACDDLWDRNFLTVLTKLLDENDHCVVAYSRMYHIDLDGSVLSDHPRLLAVSKQYDKNPFSKRFLNNSFERYLAQGGYSKVNIIYGLFRRSALVKADPVNAWGDFGWGADLLMVACALRFGEIVFSPEFLWKKTLNPGGEGSLPMRTELSSLRDAAFGSIDTYGKYLRYTAGVWKVQAQIDGANDIGMARRIIFTAYEFFRLSIIFLLQVFAAIKRRALA